MIIVLGLILLVVAAAVAVAGILSNTGSAHALTNTFTMFGHHMTGSTGTLFLYGIIVGAVGMLGLGLLQAGARRRLRHSRRERTVTRKPRGSPVEQRDTAHAQAGSAAKDRNGLTQERADLISQQDQHREQTAGTHLGPTPPVSPTPPGGDEPTPDHGHRRSHLLFGHHSPSR